MQFTSSTERKGADRVAFSQEEWQKSEPDSKQGHK